MAEAKAAETEVLVGCTGVVAADVEKVEEEACSAEQMEAEAEAEAEDGLWTCQGRCAQATAQAAKAAACTAVHTPESESPIPMQLVVDVSTGGEVAGTPRMVKGKAKRATMMSAILRRTLTSQTGDAQAQPW